MSFRRVPSEKSKLFGFKSFKSFLTLIICSQSFLLKFHYRPIAFFFFVAAVVRFAFSSQVSARICFKTLHTVFSRVLCTVQLDMPIISALFLLEYNAFVQHCHLREASCFTRALFTFCKLEHLIQAS